MIDISQILRHINIQVMEGNKFVLLDLLPNFKPMYIDILNSKLKQHGFNGSIMNIDGSFFYK